MTRSMRTAAHYDVKLHSDPGYVKAYREKIEAQRQAELAKVELLKPKTWGYSYESKSQ